jgi:hypothetical protein
MSSHSLRAKRRHPETKRERYQVSHITFELSTTAKNGTTFALIAGEAAQAKDQRPLFSGHINKGMATQLRQLAHRVEELEEKL